MKTTEIIKCPECGAERRVPVPNCIAKWRCLSCGIIFDNEGVICAS